MNRRKNEALIQTLFKIPVQEAYNEWDKSVLTWQFYYEAKQQAYENLVEELPEVAYVEDFWRIIQNGGDWETRLLDAIQTLHNGTPCQTCRNVRVKWPCRNCDTCVEAKKAHLAATKEQRKALRKRKRLKRKPKSIRKWKLSQIKRK